MVPKRLNAILSVAGQISPEDVADIAKLGFKSIVCHRPDGESDDQTSFAAIADAARAFDIETWYQPVRAGRVSLDDAQHFGEIVDDAAKPVFAYCRSGKRCTELWHLLQEDDAYATRDNAKSAPVPAPV